MNRTLRRALATLGLAATLAGTALLGGLTHAAQLPQAPSVRPAYCLHGYGHMPAAQWHAACDAKRAA